MTSTRASRPGIAVVAAFVLSLTALCFAQDKSPEAMYGALLGTWDVQTENAAYTFIFEFFLDDGRLKGKYTGSAGSTEMKGLTFENNLLHFSVTVNAMDLDYSAMIDGDKLTGRVTLQYGEADISGRKRGKQAARAS